MAISLIHVLCITSTLTIKQAEDYDSQVNAWRWGHMKAVSKADWIEAQYFGMLLASCLTPDNKISDLPKFSIEPKSFVENNQLVSKARKWCFDNMPIIEIAFSAERNKLYHYYKDGGDM